MNRLFASLIFLLNVCNLHSQSGWYQQYIPLGNHSLTSVFPLNFNQCYASAEYNTTYENYYSIYKTTNSGTNWVQVLSGTGWFIKCITFTDSLTGFAAGGLKRLYMTEDQFGKVILKTTNAGLNWFTAYQLISLPGSEMEITSQSFINSGTGWFTGRDGIILKTTNGGVNFSSQITSPNFRKNSIYFINFQNGWSAGDSGRIAFTTNGGANWYVSSKITDSHLKSVVFADEFTGFVCGNNGILFKSTNGGTNWQLLNSGVTSNLNALYSINKDTVWAAGTGIILKTTNGGINWSSQSIPFTARSIRFFDPYTGWTCGSSTMLYTNSGGIVNVSNTSNFIPDKYYLGQNYPNPFNNTTVINISIPESADTKLSLYNLLGKEVLQLINKVLSPGTYKININMQSLPGGIYFCSLTSGTFSQTRKILFVK